MEAMSSTANSVLRRLLHRASSIRVATTIRIFFLILLHVFEYVVLMLEQIHKVRKDLVHLRRGWRRREHRCVQRDCSASVNCSTEDNVVFLGIHRFQNRNRSTLENLDH
jgi:hypothetical protein